MSYKTERAWEWLIDSGRFGLKKAEQACLDVLGTDTKMRMGGELVYEGRLKELPMSVVMRLMESLSRRLEEVCNVAGMLMYPPFRRY
jgi:hypothetical protein